MAAPWVATVLVDKEMAWLVTAPLLITVTLSWLLAALLNNSFTVAVDGGTATKITLTAGTYATAGAFLTEVNARLTAAFSGTVTAAYADLAAPGDGVGALTLTSQSTAGVPSAVAIGLATTATSGVQVSNLTSATDFSGAAGKVSAALHNNSFMVTVDGGTAVKT